MKKQLLIQIFAIALLNSNLMSQAPNINYSSPQIYYVGKTINSLLPNNTGGKVEEKVVVNSFVGRSSCENGSLKDATYNQPLSLAFDKLGNLYIADAFNNKIRKISTDGIVSTFAGIGDNIFLDGKSEEAGFAIPRGIAIDTLGYIYVADYGNHRIRKISPNGIVSTLAGSNIADSIDGVGTGAYFNNPSGVAVDESGYLYVADYGNHKIRKISPSGVVTTFAGSGEAGSIDGYGKNASFNFPTDVALDKFGNVYVCDSYNNRIRKITPNGIVSTLLGSTGLSLPSGLTIDALGNVYVAEFLNFKISKISPDGNITTFAGSGANGSIDGNHSSATFYGPSDVAFDAFGNLFVADAHAIVDTNNFNKIRKISIDGQVTTYSGKNSQGSTDGIGNLATFRYPSDVVSDKLGNIYVADSDNNLIRKISPSGLVTTFSGSGQKGNKDGISTSASFNWPRGVAIDLNGFVYVADTRNNKIRKIMSDGSVITFAGSGIAGSTDGIGISASFNAPFHLSADSSGNVFVADHGNNKIRKITPDGVVTTFAGSGVEKSVDGIGINASFSSPIDIEVGKNGFIYVTDAFGKMIRKISPDGVVTTIAGTGKEGFADGTGSLASFFRPNGICVNDNGDVFVSDLGFDLIRQISAEGVVKTIAGSRTYGNSDGIGKAASFAFPSGLTLDGSGALYIADAYNNKIRRLKIYGYNISPSLPKGLIFDPNTGKISGTPNEISDLKTYTITAKNESGVSTTTLELMICDVQCETAGLENNIINNRFNIFPNPTSSSITIQINNSNNEQNLIIYSSEGRILTSTPLKTSINTIDISPFVNGIYFFEINGIREKIIVQK